MYISQDRGSKVLVYEHLKQLLTTNVMIIAIPVVHGFLDSIFLIFFSCLIKEKIKNKKKKIKKRTNRRPPRVSGIREQCKKQIKIDLYFTTSGTDFKSFWGTQTVC